MSELTEVANGLAFPEGPIAMPDGSVVLVEMFGPRLTRVLPDGSKETIAEIPGGPNGAALGPDGLFYVCNNGGRFTETDMEGLMFPGGLTKEKYIGGRIQTVDPATGTVTDLYTECDGHPLLAPNDLVFDAHGGFYFTDHGLVDDEERVAPARPASTTPRPTARASTRSSSRRDDPNGIGLSPDGIQLYWAETWRGRLQQRDDQRARRGRRARARRHVAVPVRLPRLPAARLAGRRLRPATCASRRSSTAGYRSSRRRASWSTSSRPATSSPRTSASAATTSRPRTSRCRRRDAS